MAAWYVWPKSMSPWGSCSGAILLATGPKPTSISRRYPRYHQMEPADRRLAIIRLHAEGWTISSIASYLETNRPRVYETLRRWVQEGVAGLENKPPVPKHPKRKVDLHVINEVRKLQKNPELGEFRIHAALLQIGIKLSPRTCGRILALNRSLYEDLERPETEPREPKPMPFQAARRHQCWTVDIRYLDMHQLGGGMIYVISILENFSRAILASALSRTKDLTAYLMVLYAAIRQHGSPEALTQYQSPQLPLWQLGEGEWLRVARLPRSLSPHPRSPGIEQYQLAL
jgi:transposase InsO family protein